MPTKPIKRAKETNLADYSFPLTPSNEEVLRAAFMVPGISRPAAEALLATPLLRPLTWWVRKGLHSGLSPFALAGITGIPPAKVISALERSGGVACDYCWDVDLPVVFLGWGLSFDFWEKGGPLKPGELLEEWDYIQGESFDPDTEKPRFATIGELLKSYGGRNWRRHCTRKFSGDRGSVTRNTISKAEWVEMQKVFFLKGAEK